jgi:catechol 2,3-dioxygenase-like lactoylglutathione lyase family enzyme
MPPGEFYRDVIGLAELRRRDTDTARNIMLWAGMFSALETIWQGQPHPPVNSVTDAEVVPIFRVRNWDAVIGRLESARTRFLSDAPEQDGTLFFTDPDGFVCGIRPPAAGSDLAPDIEANERWPDDLVRLPDTPPLGEGLQDIGWLRLHVADPQALATFYCRVVGLDLLENNGEQGVTLHLGETGTLELRPGGRARPVPADRKDLPDVWILRGYDFQGFADKMSANGVPLVNALTLGAGSLNYYADPEGHVFGFQERKAYNPDDPLTHRVEDRVARDAWNAKR